MQITGGKCALAEATNTHGKTAMGKTTMFRNSTKCFAASIATAIAACGVIGGEGAPVQTGQIVGGATKQITDVQPVKGFLPRPDLLARGEAGQAALVYIDQQADLSKYSKVMLDRVVISTDPDSKLSALPLKEREALVDRVQADISEELSRHCQMVQTPSANTVRLHLALTDAEKSDMAVNTVATYTPYVGAAANVAAMAFNDGVSYFAGHASAEAYMTDSKTNKLLWEAVDRRGGTGAIVKDTLNTSLDIENAFQVWAEKISRRLQDMGICPS